MLSQQHETKVMYVNDHHQEPTLFIMLKMKKNIHNLLHCVTKTCVKTKSETKDKSFGIYTFTV